MNSFKFEVGKAYNLSEIKSKLVKAGYEKVNKIDQTLQFASRGDILDIFPVSYDKPWCASQNENDYRFQIIASFDVLSTAI